MQTGVSVCVRSRIGVCAALSQSPSSVGRSRPFVFGNFTLFALLDKGLASTGPAPGIHLKMERYNSTSSLNVMFLKLFSLD